MLTKKRYSTAISFKDAPSKTQQHFQDECDITRIMQRFADTGLITHAAKSAARYGYASSQTFTEAMQTVATAKEEFAQLPSELRAKFNNDPAQFLDAAADPDQRDTFVELGLLEPLPPKDAPAASSEPVAATKTEASADSEPKA